MKLPMKIETNLRSHIQIWRRDQSHGVIVRPICPHKLYRYTFAGKCARCEPIGWRVFLKTKDKKTVALDLIGTGAYRFYVGGVAWQWLKRAQVVERRTSVKGYEPRILTIPSIHRTLLWFAGRRGANSDLFDYLDPKPRGKSRWMIRREVDELVKESVAEASRMWRAAKTRALKPTRQR